MLQFNPATVVLLLIAALAGAWLAGFLKVRYDEGRLTVRLLRDGRFGTTFELRDSWLLLALAITMGWAVAIAVERSTLVPGTDGRLVPALAAATVVGWVLIVSRFSRMAYLVTSLPALIAGVAIFTTLPLTSLPALRKWFVDLPNQPNLLLLMALIAMFVATGLWTSWWVFRRRNGLVALLPTGTILAVEIVNDTSLGVTFFAGVWVAAAACLLLRLNFVALKEGWRTRRLPRSADSGWTFGEIGIEATLGILLLAFVLIPPLSSTDISGMLIPGVVHTDAFHPFGLGNGSQSVGVGSIGYSEVVQPGSQLNARSQPVMVISGDAPAYYPYWRGIALARWDGIKWDPLPSTPEIPVRQQPVLSAQINLPRDDLPDGPHLQLLHTTFRVVVGADQTLGTVFSAGEIVSVDNQPTKVRGIMTSVPATQPGPVPAPVNVAGSSDPTATFDTVDAIYFARRLQPPYTYSLTEAIPNVDVADLEAASRDYPPWLAPYESLYYDNVTAQGYSTARDAEIGSLAKSIVIQAGATNPYTQAKAIETWLRSSGGFHYLLKHPTAPVGTRPLDYFLFDSKKGVCQDFSTAMNVMLRMLGIPSRQMSGFGQGVVNDRTHQYVVNALDAHSWVEVFFPGYGWIPFEPTPDGLNQPINRPATAAILSALGTATVEATPRNVRPNLRDPQASLAGGSVSTPFPDIWRPILIVALGLLLLVIIAMLVGLRWLLGVRDVPRIWRRLLFLGDRLKVPRHPGDTPEEFAGRLAASIPPLEDDVERLATLYTRANFRQGGLSAEELADARRAWGGVRRSYTGLMVKAWRDAWRQGRVVREEEAEASESREPSPRH